MTPQQHRAFLVQCIERDQGYLDAILKDLEKTGYELTYSEECYASDEIAFLCNSIASAMSALDN